MDKTATRTVLGMTAALLLLSFLILFSIKDMAKVSDDHAHESLCMEASKILSSPACLIQGKQPRRITPEEIQQHNDGQYDDTTTTTNASFWAVIDGWVVDATDFLTTHPGGLKKLLSADSADVGATGKPFGFSLSRGKNGHFPETGRRFQAGVKQYLQGITNSTSDVLPPGKVVFSPDGTLLILGLLSNNG